MNRNISIFMVVAISVTPAIGQDDLLRFINGDQLHGNFRGITAGPTISWERKDLNEVAEFKTSDVRHVVLGGGEQVAKSAGLAHLGTMNGDRIPGNVVELDSEKVVLQTPFAGTLEIAREDVGLIAPNPLGGKVLYHGPFEKKSWRMVSQEHADGLPEPEDEKKDELSNARWKFSGSAWYWDQKGFGTGLVRDDGMADKSIFKFDASWKGRLSLAVGFHSDFAKPEKIEEENVPVPGQVGRSSSLPAIFGNSYVLHLYSNYVSLYRTSISEEGQPKIERLQSANGIVRLGDTGKASVEIRCNRATGEILLFINEQFVAQWTELIQENDLPSGYAGKGNGFGFLVQTDDSPVRISEVLVAEWNGMPDAARSLQVDDADIVLLANGTDRFSGKVIEISQSKLTIESRYGDFVLPMDEIAEIRFAKSGLAEAEEEMTNQIKIRFHPVGRISGKPLEGDAGGLRILHGSAGEIDVNLDSATILEFQEGGTFIDDWDAEF